MKSSEGVELKIGDVVEVMVDRDFIDRINTNRPHEIFNFQQNPEGEDKVGIKHNDAWYYVSPLHLKHWKVVMTKDEAMEILLKTQRDGGEVRQKLVDRCFKEDLGAVDVIRTYGNPKNW